LTNEIVTIEQIALEQNLAKDDIARLVEAFGGPFDEAGAVLATYHDHEVTDCDDVETMAKARDARLVLRKVRTTVEKKRKDLKDASLRQGRAIDSVAKWVKSNIEPAETWLLEQEKFAEIQEAERLALLKAERELALRPFGADTSLYVLEKMTEEQFEDLMQSVMLKAERDAEAARLRALEEKRIADEDQERRKKLALVEAENAKLRAEMLAQEQAAKKAEAEARAKEAQAERERQQLIQAEARAKAYALTAQAEAESARVQLAQEAEVVEPSEATNDAERLRNFAMLLDKIAQEQLGMNYDTEAAKAARNSAVVGLRALHIALMVDISAGE
jgi:hypothetical protein